MAKYNSYKGRRRGRTVLGVMIGILLVAVAVILFLASTRQIVFTSDGPQLASRVTPTPDLPTSSPSTRPSTEPTLIIENPSPTATPEPTPEPTPESGRPERMIAVQLDPRDEVAFNGAIQLANDGRINAVVLSLGEKTGALHWTPSVQLAHTIGAVPDPTNSFDLGRISELHDAGLYVVARMSSLKESYLGNYDKEYAVKWADGRRWLDGDKPKSLGWLDPYSEVARGYITDLVLELIKGGADEVLLDNFSFPTSGYTDSIAFAGEQTQTRADVLAEFYRDLSTRAEALGGSVSVSIGSELINNYIAYGVSLPAGLTPPDGATVYSAAADERAGEVAVVSVDVGYADPTAPAILSQLIGEHTGSILLVSTDGRYPASW